MTSVIRSIASSTADEAEWALRCDMAAIFRLCARFGWSEKIGNHNSVMLPGEEKLFLINPRGSLFCELRASDLLICDLDGRVISGRGELRKVAFHIHARIHLGNPNAVAVIHVHPQYLTALSMIDGGRLALAHHNNLILNDRVAYDTEGYAPVDDNEEGDRIARLLGQKTIVLGGRDVPLRANMGIYTQPISFVGLPVAAVPVCEPDALPYGIQVIASPWREDHCLRVAAALEVAGLHRRG